ncbi:MAG: DUF2189 domain-containing protein [Rhizobiales bacterium]|nr:DUF2189 domain-containing protein [Hyphomicrobiales bacterium]
MTDALKAGLADFIAAPLYGLFFGGVCAGLGLLILVSLSKFGVGWMIIPIAVGFPLVGPFMAAGLYEVSRRRSAGSPLNWREIVFLMFYQRERQFAYVGILVMCIFWIWMFAGRILFALFIGSHHFAGMAAFAETMLTTPHGLGFLAVGSLLGAILAFVLFASTVITMPMLVERDVDIISAIITSFNTVYASPFAMIGWGIVVTALLILAMLPAFLGLVVVLPILGHATWHLYKRAIVA